MPRPTTHHSLSAGDATQASFEVRSQFPAVGVDGEATTVRLYLTSDADGVSVTWYLPEHTVHTSFTLTGDGLTIRAHDAQREECGTVLARYDITGRIVSASRRRRGAAQRGAAARAASATGPARGTTRRDTQSRRGR